MGAFNSSSAWRRRSLTADFRRFPRINSREAQWRPSQICVNLRSSVSKIAARIVELRSGGARASCPFWPASCRPASGALADGAAMDLYPGFHAGRQDAGRCGRDARAPLCHLHGHADDPFRPLPSIIFIPRGAPLAGHGNLRIKTQSAVIEQTRRPPVRKYRTDRASSSSDWSRWQGNPN